jgi:Tfp pilus assembly major pilin PilA
MAKIPDILATGVGGVLPMLMAEEHKSNAAAGKAATAAEKERQAAIAASAQGQPMKKGGMTASRRADGIAQRGKTRGKMC